MKVSIAASILILLIAALFVVPGHQRLTAIRESHAKLVAAAAQLGVSIDPTQPDDPLHITKRGRENREADAKHSAAEFIAFAKEVEAIQQEGRTPDEAMQKRMLELIERMMSLDSAQLKILIAEVRAATDLKDESRQNIIGFSIMAYASDHPQAALTLFTESSDLFTENGMGTHVISSSLAKWAKEDPLAALEWLKNHSAKFSNLISDDAKRGLISGTAAQDPKLAFSLIGELEVKDKSPVISQIVAAAKTPKERSAMLVEIRAYLSTLDNDEALKEAGQSASWSLASSLATESFESATQWIDSSNLTPGELEAVASGIPHTVKSKDSGQWIEWLGEKLPPQRAAENINDLVRTWTRGDYQAAGKWLSTAAAGPTKNTAIRAYAETVSRYEPTTAAQWALTLPPGKDRDATLSNIYHNWPRNDTAAKEAFKQEHGIK